MSVLNVSVISDPTAVKRLLDDCMVVIPVILSTVESTPEPEIVTVSRNAQHAVSGLYNASGRAIRLTACSPNEYALSMEVHWSLSSEQVEMSVDVEGTVL